LILKGEKQPPPAIVWPLFVPSSCEDLLESEPQQLLLLACFLQLHFIRFSAFSRAALAQGPVDSHFASPEQFKLCVLAASQLPRRSQTQAHPYLSDSSIDRSEKLPL
jgi:hypothetical protein